MAYTQTLPNATKRSRFGRQHREGQSDVRTTKAAAIIRTFLGIVFVVSGLNGFLKFLPQFTVSGEGANFLDALVDSYFWPVLKIVELAIGGALLFNVYAQFAIFILAPVTLGILLFHVFLSPPGAWFAWTIFACEVAMVVIFRKQIKSVFFTPNGADSGKVIHDDVSSR